MALPIPTKGHCELHGGLRGHTVNETYPFNAIAIGHEPTQWACFDARNGHTGTLWPNCDLAYLDCQLEKVLEGLSCVQ